MSIVIPCRDYEFYILKALQSVLAQDYEHIELLVIDDGSFDDSAKIVLQWAQEHGHHLSGGARLIRCKESVGKLAALNRGLPTLRGKWTIILDADDELFPDYVSRTVRLAMAKKATDPRLAFVYTDCFLVDAQSRVLGRGRSRVFDAALVEHSSYIPECAPTWTEALLEVLPLDPAVSVGTKHLKWREVVARGWRGHYLAEPLFRYRMHDRNLSGIGKQVLSEQGSAAERLLNGYWPTVSSPERRRDNG